jgi:hypothetical protein
MYRRVGGFWSSNRHRSLDSFGRPDATTRRRPEMRAKTKGKHEMGKRFAILIGAAAALMAGLAGLATAKSTSDPENDNTGDNCPPTNSRYCSKSFDFVKVSADHSGANLVHKAKVRGNSKEVPLLSISTDKAKDCEYILGIPPGSDVIDDGSLGTVVRGYTVVNCDTAEEAPAKYVGKAGERGFKFVFSPDSIGNPNKYRWQFAYLADRGVLADEAPNKPDVSVWFGRPCPAAKYPCRR